MQDRYRWDLLVSYAVLGMTADQAAGEVGRPVSWVKQQYNKPEFQADVAARRSKVLDRALAKPRFQKLHDRIAAEAEVAFDKLVQVRDDPETKPQLLVQVCQDMLDRYPESQKGESRTFRMDPDALRAAAETAVEMDRPVIDVTPQEGA